MHDADIGFVKSHCALQTSAYVRTHRTPMYARNVCNITRKLILATTCCSWYTIPATYTHGVGGDDSHKILDTVCFAQHSQTIKAGSSGAKHVSVTLHDWGADIISDVFFAAAGATRYAM